MSYLKKLQELRDEKVQSMEAMLNKAKTEERAMGEEEMTSFDALEKEIGNIDETMKVEKRTREKEHTQKKGGEEKPEEAGETGETEVRAFTNFVFDNQVELRAGGVQLTQGENGTIVPTTIANRIIKAVQDMVPFLQMADVIHTSGKLSVPVYGEDSNNFISAGYVDEGEDLADNVGKFTTIDLTGFMVGALALVSKKLVNNTDIDVVGFIVNQVAEAMAETLEKEFINGTESKITGLISCEKGMVTASSNSIINDELVSLKHSLKQRFRDKGVFIMHPTTYTAICKLRDNDGHPYFKEDEYKILGCRVIESDNMPLMGAGKKAIVFADLTGYTIKATTAVEVQILKETFATKNMLGVMTYCEYDGKITDSKKIAVLTMKTA